MLRRKEWALLRRDPWLISQTLMQLLYLLPPALLLWRSHGDATGVEGVLTPVLIMSAGQLAGALAWLAISGEDAPDLIATAPVTARQVLVAKINSVLGATGIVFGPFVLAFALVSAKAALISAIGIVVAAAGLDGDPARLERTAKRSHFRRRHTSSRIATFAEAFSSIGWAATGAFIVLGSWVALLPRLPSGGGPGRRDLARASAEDGILISQMKRKFPLPSRGRGFLCVGEWLAWSRPAAGPSASSRSASTKLRLGQRLQLPSVMPAIISARRRLPGVTSMTARLV